MKLNFSREIKEVAQMMEKSRTQVTRFAWAENNNLKITGGTDSSQRDTRVLTKITSSRQTDRSSHTSQCHILVSTRSDKANTRRENQRLHHILDHRDNRDPENYVG
jgi:predicted RNase H-related nuclease YkuK (DUF458 family)